MSRAKAADEIFCQSCGERIKKQAEICPECGVRNDQAQDTQRGSAVAPHDPSQYTTTVSETWYYGIAVGIGLWIVTIAVSGLEIGGALEPLLGLLVIVAWVLLPVATYFDARYVRANSQWNPNTAAWCIAGAIWFVNIVSGLLYLYRRYETIGKP